MVFELVLTLEKHYRVPRMTIQSAVQPLLELSGIILPGKSAYRVVFALWVTEPGLAFADCAHAVVARRLDSATMISFDRKLSRVPGLTRIEP